MEANFSIARTSYFLLKVFFIFFKKKIFFAFSRKTIFFLLQKKENYVRVLLECYVYTFDSFIICSSSKNQRSFEEEITEQLLQENKY